VLVQVQVTRTCQPRNQFIHQWLLLISANKQCNTVYCIFRHRHHEEFPYINKHNMCENDVKSQMQVRGLRHKLLQLNNTCCIHLLITTTQVTGLSLTRWSMQIADGQTDGERAWRNRSSMQWLQMACMMALCHCAICNVGIKNWIAYNSYTGKSPKDDTRQNWNRK